MFKGSAGGARSERGDKGGERCGERSETAPPPKSHPIPHAAAPSGGGGEGGALPIAGPPHKVRVPPGIAILPPSLPSKIRTCSISFYKFYL